MIETDTQARMNTIAGRTILPGLKQSEPVTQMSGASPLRSVEQIQSFEPWLSAVETAEFLGRIHPKTLMRKARAGLVPGYMKFSRWYFLASQQF